MFMERLYGNVGRLIKILAFIGFIVVAALSIGWGLFLILEVNQIDKDEILRNATQVKGLKCIFLYPIFAFLSSAFTYAFGELVERVCKIEGYMKEAREERLYDDAFEEYDEYDREFEAVDKDAEALENLKKRLNKCTVTELEMLLTDQKSFFSAEELKIIFDELKKRR